MEKMERFEQHAGMLKWVASVDHKQIAVMYMLTSLFFFLVGGVEALLMRWQLANPRTISSRPRLTTSSSPFMARP